MSNNNSTNRKQHNDKKLQHTSRITPRIKEYLAVLANDREKELQRFMALSSTSPASSCVSISGGAPYSDAMRNSAGSLSHSRSRSRSNSTGVATAASAAAKAIRKQKRCASPPDTVIKIPIIVDTIGDSCRRIPSASVEDLRTPTKGTQTQTPQMQTRKTQTPESAFKSHKRLEWDPAADVGYRCDRAASVNNISTLERSVLEAATQRTEAGVRPNHSESDLNRLQEQEQEQKEQKEQQRSQGTAPPLASSTLVNSTRVYSSQPQTTLTPTPTSVPSHSSRRESCATSAVSSFDYHQNSRPSTGGTSASNSSARHTLSAEELLRHVEQRRQEREYKAQLEQVLCNRRHVTRAQNKENQQPQRPKSSGSSSSSSCPPGRYDLDLGVELLCSLVSKRSLSHVQKKQLVHDIAKRLACLDLMASTGYDSTRSSRRNQRKEQASPAKKDKDTLSHRQPLRKDISTSMSQTDIHELSPMTPAPASPAVAVVSARESEKASVPGHVPVPVPAPRTRLATPGISPLPCSYASTSSGASNELVTQKTNDRVKSAREQHKAAVAEQAAVQEWLNPLTQSEIEYEEKRQQRDQLDTQRRKQLDWIEAEIVRLRTLQNLLNTASKGMIVDTTKVQDMPNIHLRDADGSRAAVAGSANALVAPTGAAPAPPAPPVTPVSTPPATVPAAATAALPFVSKPPGVTLSKPPPPPPPARKQPANRPQMQRGKMATPVLSNSGSSESVCSFVQQRQRQFMAHYQNQQQQRLEQQQQQQQLLKRQQKKQQHQYATCPVHQCPYALQQQQQQQQYMQMQYTQAAGNAYGCNDEDAIYYHVVSTQGRPCHMHAHAAATVTATQTKAAVAATAAAAAGTAAIGAGSTSGATASSPKVPATRTTCTMTSSTSSMLCISSEMSIPISLANACETTTTTTTTTHQYDDVACHQQLHLRQRHTQTQHSSSSSDQQRQQQQQQQQQQPHLKELKQSQLMLQVRPRGIAYVIQFSSNGDCSEIVHETLTLQDYLQRARPVFCAKSKQRKAILNQMQLLRNERRRELEQLIEQGSLESLDKRLHQLPPPVISRVRIFSTREMKALTNKRCESLPEVLAAQSRQLEERRRRSNRIMRDVFNRRLQRRVRSGKLSLNHSRTVI